MSAGVNLIRCRRYGHGLAVLQGGGVCVCPADKCLCPPEAEAKPATVTCSPSDLDAHRKANLAMIFQHATDRDLIQEIVRREIFPPALVKLLTPDAKSIS